MNIAKLNTASLDDKTFIIKRGEGGETINNQDKSVDITENGTTEVVADGGYTGLGKVTINTEVGGETINNQDKVVDITENGTTEIVADGGYTGLGKVTINTEVSGGGEGSNLSPDAIVYEPNGWYWKWVEVVPSDFESSANILLGITYDFGARYYGGIIQDTRSQNSPYKSSSILLLGATLRSMQNNADNRGLCVIAVAESKYCSMKIDDTTTLTGNSIYEMISQFQQITEAEFEGMFQENYGLKRITKEEYEALITQ